MKKKVRKEELLKKGNDTIKEFKTFICRGNVIDMAVGVIIGSAFGKIVTSLVNDILMPLIGIVIGGLDFTNLTVKIKDATVSYGVFIQNIIDFLIVATCIFLFVKIIARFNKKEKKDAAGKIKKEEQLIVLEEIRDLLKKQVERKEKWKTFLFSTKYDKILVRIWIY